MREHKVAYVCHNETGLLGSLPRLVCGKPVYKTIAAEGRQLRAAITCVPMERAPGIHGMI
jgi:hypothetical protein